MRILVAVALVLLIGVFDVSLAKRPNVPTASSVFGKIQRFSKVGNLKGQTASVSRRRSDTSESDEDSGIIAECTMHGGPGTWENAEPKIVTAAERAVAHMDNPVFVAKLEAVTRTNDSAPIVLYLCSMKSDLKNITAEIAEAAKPCFDDNVKSAIEVMKNLIFGLIENLCQGDGQPFATFLNTGGLECSSEKFEDLKECVHPLFTDHSEEVSDTVNETEPESADHHKLTIARNCIKNVFDSYHNPDNTAYAIRVFDGLFTPIFEHPTYYTTTATIFEHPTYYTTTATSG